MLRHILSQPIPRAILALIILGLLVVIGRISYPALIGMRATPTATVTSTVTPSATFTLAPTSTSTPAATETPSPSKAPTGTDTATPTEALTPTFTSIPEETPTFTPIPEETPTLTPTPEETPTFTPTPTETPAPTSTPTPTPTPSEALPPTPTATPTGTPTFAPTPTPSISGLLAVPLLYGIEPKIYVASTDGEQLGVLGAARQPDYRRDGGKLLVNGDMGEWMLLREEEPTGGSPREIGDPGLTEHGHPAWSPDGTQIIYDDALIDPAGSRIFTRDLDTNGPGTGPGTMLQAGVGIGQIIGRYPLWASGDRFIFNGCNTWEPGQEGECGIWLMEGNGGTPERLTNSSAHIPTDLHGDLVVYVSREAGDWNVYTLNIVGGQRKQITSDTALDGLATISPDGRWIAFLSNREGGLAVWVVGIGGGTPQRLFDVPSTWGGLRSDGWSEEKLSWGRSPD